MTRYSEDEEEDFTQLAANYLTDPQSRGIKGLDELADVLNVEPNSRDRGINLMGMSGNIYSLIEILTSHLLVIAEDIARRESK